jgi:hypothetical protein
MYPSGAALSKFALKLSNHDFSEEWSQRPSSRASAGVRSNAEPNNKQQSRKFRWKHLFASAISPADRLVGQA